MNEVSFKDKDVLVMKLLHYFITEKGYNPIILRGIDNEIWLENMDAPYRIVRINTGYIHNKAQYDFDMFKTKRIMSRIKLKTFSFSLNTLSLFLDLGESVELTSNNAIDCVKVTSEKDIKSSKEIVDAYPDIKDKLEFNEKGIALFVKMTSDINKKNMESAKEAEEVFKEKTPIITYGLLIVNTIIFILMYILGNGSNDIGTLIKFGALAKDLVLNGQYFRLLTSAFLHIGIMHLVCNMYALYILGKDIESYYGKVKYAFIYLTSALIGSLLSMVFMSEYSVSAGASGAIFGLMGSLLYFGYNYRATLNNSITKQILPVIILNLFIGFTSTGINNYAHIGGLIGGYISSIVVGVKYKTSNSEQRNGSIALFLLILFLIYMSFFK
ncbi:MAG: rhomboid family intramembrane serine protease [Bacilli bacterium]|nr:rhomboid family intramembrane serine protease [Bacilli bacterium]